MKVCCAALSQGVSEKLIKMILMSRFLILISLSNSSVLSEAGMKLLVFISFSLFASCSVFSFIRIKSVSRCVTELFELINKQNFLRLPVEAFIFVIDLCRSGL